MIIAIDLGIKCGWAATRGPYGYIAGVDRIDDCCDDLRSILDALLPLCGPMDLDFSLLAYESAAWHQSKASAELYGRRVGVLETWAALQNPPLRMESVKPSDVRKAAGVKSRYATKDFEGTPAQRKRQAREAGKAAMVAKARLRWPDLDVLDDNVADALWMLEVARQRWPGSV